MNKGMLSLMVACLILNQFATAQEECEEDDKKVVKAMAETIQSGEFSCIEEHQLEQWKFFEDDEDKAKTEQKKKEFIIWMSEKSKEDQKDIEKCSEDVLQSSLERVKGGLQPKCVEMFKKKMQTED